MSNFNTRIQVQQILETLEKSPSVELLRLRNREMIIAFLANTFPVGGARAVSADALHRQLSDFIEHNQIDHDEESEISAVDTYEIKSKKYIQSWTNKGFLTNYQDEHGDIFYELSTHSGKTIDWLVSLKKEEYVGTESKFRNIFNQLKELVEFTNENTAKRIEILKERKAEIEQQIRRIKSGEDVKVFEEYEIVPRFNQISQSARELLSDFREVEDNFKEITKNIYQIHTDTSATKGDVLEFTFEALDMLKESQQGKSFYAFWAFLMNSGMQQEWDDLTRELYQTLADRSIPVSDQFLRGMKGHLYQSGQKVNKANDKMASKLSRIIHENEAAKSELTRNLIQDIKKLLVEISKTGIRPDISFELETDIEIRIPFERKLTAEQSEETVYDEKPRIADENIIHSNQLGRLFSQTGIDKELLRKRVKDMLRVKSQASLLEVVESCGGIEKGLPELFGYIGILKEFKHTVSPDRTESVLFDRQNGKTIKIPEIILVR